MITSCTCENKGQDKLYGPGNRVHNLLHGETLTGRCTVCAKNNTGKQSDFDSSSEKGKKK